MGNILLIGTRGTGKSAVGRRTVALLGGDWRFLEMDEALVARLGMPIGDFFAARGEAAFREEERALLAEIAQADRQIIACGGGVAGTVESLAAARAAGVLVWLDTPVPELLARRLADPHEAARPPLLAGFDALKAGDLKGYLRIEIPTILARRRPCYARADFILATTGLDAERLAAIVAALAERGV
ncbi:MAG: shikimate kinase [Armatimonadetes bacterium]|nr:shikimate kinase [Armatimonadota bacterium]